MKALQRSLIPAFLLLAGLAARGQEFQLVEEHQYVYPRMRCIDVTLPVTIGMVDYDVRKKHIPGAARQKVKKILVDFYEWYDGDKNEVSMKLKESYFCTLRIPYGDLELYVVILTTPVVNHCHCRLFLYDPSSKECSSKDIDFNIWASYEIKEGDMRPSYQRVTLRSLYPDIESTGAGGRSIKLRRLWHNGTFNALEESTYRPKGIELDSVDRKRVELTGL